MCALAMDRSVSWSVLARRVGCHRSTIEREVTRNGGRDDYSAQGAQRRARHLATRSRFIFDTDQSLAGEVRRLLVAGYSPFAVARTVGVVCAETIYQGIYSGRLGLDPTRVLRTRRPKRRHRHLRQPTSDGNYLGTFTPISQRPTAVEDREEFGHWEGDLITGTANQSAIITLIERVTRYQVALTLPDGHSADHTMDRLTHWLTDQTPVRSLTWDRGAELTRWKRLQDHHGIDVYFCDPKSPWQRASNENANRQLRFWFPRRTDLSIYTQEDLNRACDIINTTPRRIHNNHTAQHLYHQHTRPHH
jgi:IS30 family transposase